MTSINEHQLVKLSAEALTLRQRVAQLQRENTQLRTALGNRTTVADLATITISGTSRTNERNGHDYRAQ